MMKSRGYTLSEVVVGLAFGLMMIGVLAVLYAGCHFIVKYW